MCQDTVEFLSYTSKVSVNVGSTGGEYTTSSGRQVVLEAVNCKQEVMSFIFRVK